MKHRAPLLLAALLPASAWAWDINPSCSDWHMKQEKGSDVLELRCYAKPDRTWLRLGNCPGATATRSRATGIVTIFCPGTSLTVLPTRR